MRPLEIGLVCPYSMQTPGGVQNQVLGLAGELTSLGHRVRVLAPGRVDPQRLRDYGLRPEQVDSAGTAVPVPYNGSVARVNFGPHSRARVRRWVRTSGFDLLHLHEPITPSISGWALTYATGPVVATFHTATPRSRTMEVAGLLLQSTIGKIDAGIAVSETARRVVVQHLGRDAQVIPNGFRRVGFNGRPSGPTSEHRGPWRNGHRPRLVYLGRLDEPRKGVDVLLAALPAIRAGHPELEVVIAGQGRRKLPDFVHAPGPVDDRQRAELLASADLFVAPHVARESFGIVLIEAMASAAAVLASDLAPFVDLLGPSGEFGYLFCAGDADGLAQGAVVALADDRSELTRRAAASTERFDWSQVGAEILDVYRSVLDAEPVPALDPATLRAARQALRRLAGPGLSPDRRRELEAEVDRLLDVEPAPDHDQAAGLLAQWREQSVRSALVPAEPERREQRQL